MRELPVIPMDYGWAQEPGLIHKPAAFTCHELNRRYRAGKDLISSLASGLLAIGSCFGSALDEAASMFSNSCDTGLTPRESVDESRKANKL
ncbi:hypothetical protein DFH11DRAFT_1570054, partial [Phellopilus nigrolimitatus]